MTFSTGEPTCKPVWLKPTRCSPVKQMAAIQQGNDKSHQF